MTSPGSHAVPFCGIAVMAKASAPGRTKTRLVPPLSANDAALLNTSFLRDIADNLLLAARSAPIAGYMAFGPSDARPFFEGIVPSGIGLIESWLGRFGECLLHATTALFERGHGAACVLNADSPTLPTAILIELTRALAEPGDRAVLGPSDDGGYYVLGLKTLHRRLFQDIDWSTERVAEQTLARAREIGLPVHVLPVWYDVDDLSTLCRLQRDLSSSRIADDGGFLPYRASHTRALLGTFARDVVAERGQLVRGAAGAEA